MGYELEDRCLLPGMGKILFSSPQLPDRLWGPPNLMFIGYRDLFPRE
jgi:hypothetical protein